MLEKHPKFVIFSCLWLANCYFANHRLAIRTYIPILRMPGISSSKRPLGPDWHPQLGGLLKYYEREAAGKRVMSGNLRCI